MYLGVSLEPKYEERVRQIDQEIKRLQSKKIRNVRNNGLDSKTFFRIDDQINELMNEKIRILNGIQQKIDSIKAKIVELDVEMQKTSKLSFTKRKLINKQIAELNTNLEQIQRGL